MRILHVAARVASRKYAGESRRTSGDIFDILSDLYDIKSIDNGVADMLSRGVRNPDDEERDDDSQETMRADLILRATFDKIFGTDFRNDTSSFMADVPWSFTIHELLHHAIVQVCFGNKDLVRG